MRRFIHKLRQKPKSTRRKIALGTSTSVTGLIFVIWLTVIVQGGGLTPTQESPQTQTASPISAIKGNASAAFSSLQARLGDRPGSTSTASANKAVEINDSTQATTANRQANDSTNTERVEKQPYWQANDSASGQDTRQRSKEPEKGSQTSGNFWQEDQNSEGDSGGWF